MYTLVSLKTLKYTRYHILSTSLLMQGINTEIEQEQEPVQVLTDVKDNQPNLLDEAPTLENISTRQGKGGKKFHYYETHVVIRMANQIFGFDGWSSEVVDQWFSEPLFTNNKYSVSCFIRMRVTLRESKVYHEDYGNATKVDADPATARVDAAKTATSDALKRTLRLFGDILGNKLYDKKFLYEVDTQKKVTHQVPVAKTPIPAKKSAYKSPIPVKQTPPVRVTSSTGIKRGQFGTDIAEQPKKAKLLNNQFNAQFSNTATSSIASADKSLIINSTVSTITAVTPTKKKEPEHILDDDEDNPQEIENLYKRIKK